MKLTIYIFLIFVIGFTSCSSKTSSSRKPVTNIQITPSNKVVKCGNEFSLSFQSKITKPKIKKLDVYFNNKLIHSGSEESYSITIDSDTLLPGKYPIKVVVTNEKGKTGINYNAISIISDITPEKLTYKIVEILPHNTKNYIEGFEFYNDLLYEGTGNYNESYIYAYNPENQKIKKSIKNDKQYFGEGITILNNKLYQLTYKAKKGFVYDANTFEKIKEFSFKSDEGWGLTNNGKSLIMSNGTSTITYINPETFEIEKEINVSTPQGFINQINELEYVEGVFYANIWTRETILKFDEKGRVLAIIDMRGLMDKFKNKRIDVLNGIAYNPKENLFYVTGKWWPEMYKVRFIEQ